MASCPLLVTEVTLLLLAVALIIEYGNIRLRHKATADSLQWGRVTIASTPGSRYCLWVRVCRTSPDPAFSRLRPFPIESALPDNFIQVLYDRAEEGADSIRQAHGKCAPKRDAQGTGGTTCAAGVSRKRPENRQRPERRAHDNHRKPPGRNKKDNQKRQGRSDSERARRRKSRLHRTSTLDLGNTKLVTRMGPRASCAISWSTTCRARGRSRPLET